MRYTFLKLMQLNLTHTKFAYIIKSQNERLDRSNSMFAIEYSNREQVAKFVFYEDGYELISS